MIIYVAIHGARAPKKWFENRLLDLLREIRATDSLQVLWVNHSLFEVVLEEKKTGFIITYKYYPPKLPPPFRSKDRLSGKELINIESYRGENAAQIFPIQKVRQHVHGEDETLESILEIVRAKALPHLRDVLLPELLPA